MIARDARNDIRQVALRSALVAALGMVAFAGVALRPLTAQVARRQAAAAQAQPRFTRIFGSDSMSIGFSSALSPDGRWVVFSRVQGSDTSNLWVVPASGGAPTQLTSGRHSDYGPRWFPSGDRIAFVSDRPSPPGGGNTYVMTIPFDAQTGRTTGPAQQVSLEPCYDAGGVSPDGRWILFETPGLPGTHRLMVVPSTGGAARTVVRTDGIGNIPQWSPDGREIYFVDRAHGPAERAVLRVAAEGGQPQRVWSTSRRIWMLSTATRQLLTLSDASLSGSQVAQILTFEGRPVASVPLHRNMLPSSLTGDGRSVLAVVSDAVAPIRVVPVAGGPSRSLTQAREYDDPDTWTADASRLAVRTRMNGHAALLDVPIDGGQAAEIPTPPEASEEEMLWPDRSHLIYVVSDSATGRKSLRVRRLSDGRTREIARDWVLPSWLFAAGPGGSRFRGEEVLYFERRGDRFELRAYAPEGQPHVLRSFPRDFSAAGIGSGVGVYGERVAWTAGLGDSSALFVAEGPNGTPRRIAVVQGSLRFPVWSPDGRWIAASYYAAGGNPSNAVFVVGVTPDGQPSAPPRLVDAGFPASWDIQWLPDSRAVTVLGMTGGFKTDIWLISLREGDPPVNLTRDDPSVMWDYSLSPDGRYIAYPAEIPRGSSIWRIDLRP